LGQRETDTNNWMLTITELTSHSGLVNPAQSDHINQKLTLTVVSLSCAHCITKNKDWNKL